MNTLLTRKKVLLSFKNISWFFSHDRISNLKTLLRLPSHLINDLKKHERERRRIWGQQTSFNKYLESETRRLLVLGYTTLLLISNALCPWLSDMCLEFYGMALVDTTVGNDCSSWVNGQTAVYFSVMNENSKRSKFEEEKFESMGLFRGALTTCIRHSRSLFTMSEIRKWFQNSGYFQCG